MSIFFFYCFIKEEKVYYKYNLDVCSGKKQKVSSRNKGVGKEICINSSFNVYNFLLYFH